MHQQLPNTNVQFQTNASLKIIRLPAVKNLTGCSRSSIYFKISHGLFPRPISLGSRSVGWLESEVISWLEERIQARSCKTN
ncbi:MAG: helix-turn-helix transcriptional regulator [Gammaproteobacteria bacterium]